MSSHYEVVFSLFLREDTPVGVLDELRWHLGLSPERPEDRAVEYGEQPVLLPHSQTYLPGSETATLRHQYRWTLRGIDEYSWGLHVRLYWLDDHWADVWWQVVYWLAPYADDGYAGFVREVASDQPTLLVIHDGQPDIREYDES